MIVPLCQMGPLVVGYLAKDSHYAHRNKQKQIFKNCQNINKPALLK